LEKLAKIGFVSPIPCPACKKREEIKNFKLELLDFDKDVLLYGYLSLAYNKNI